MNTNELVRNLEALIERHKDDKYNSFETRWVDVLKDCNAKIHELLTDIDRLNKVLETRDRSIEKNMDREIELAIMDDAR